MNYALIKDGVVINIFVCDDTEIARDLFPGDVVAEIGDNEAGIGWSYENGAFSAPAAQEKSHDELVADAESEKRGRVGAATSKIVFWQTKLLMGRKLTDDESVSLNAWMDYIDAVTAIDTSSAPDIIWPVTPAQDTV
ncbi:tail fiber assembly protein [Citrobacter braakii]|uniref:tail fiber assembly protein n=1 Tax=Citrobacter braakii TaxID=57706 RepID=UPI0023B22D48|nr:tail fiber assembly protein [Citrobacter braakii]MDE9659454.1 tail fiber assembly protein [Citrobacter braakii]